MFFSFLNISLGAYHGLCDSHFLLEPLAVDRRIEAILAKKVSNKCSDAAGIGGRSEGQEQKGMVEACDRMELGHGDGKQHGGDGTARHGEVEECDSTYLAT